MSIGKVFRVPAVLLAACVLLSMPATAEAQGKKVVVMWEGKSAMVDSVMMGFMSKIRQLAPDMDVKLHRNLKDAEESEKVYRESEKRVDGIIFLRSTGAEFLAKAHPTVPSFVGGCNNPVELGVIKNLEAPEGMITGVTYFIPYEKKFAIIKALFPGVKSIGLLVEKGHPGTPIDQEGSRKQCQALGLAYREVVASSVPELIAGVKSLSGQVDLFIISSTRLAMDNVVNILPIANESKTPIFSFADKPVKAGAVAGMAADDTKLGAMLAESVVEVVVKGKPVAQVPVKMDPQPRISINKAMMKSLGLTFPDAILKEAILVE